MTVLYFLAGLGVAIVAMAMLGAFALRALDDPRYRLAVMNGILDGIAPYFPAIAVVDIEGVERLIQFSALRESLIRIAQGQALRDRERREGYDA
jgi:hypothetical protein